MTKNLIVAVFVVDVRYSWTMDEYIELRVNNDSKSLKMSTASRTPSTVVILAAAVAATRIARANASNVTSCCPLHSSSPTANTIKLSKFASNRSRRRLVDLRGSRDATRLRNDDDGDADESAKCFSKISVATRTMEDAT